MAVPASRPIRFLIPQIDTIIGLTGGIGSGKSHAAAYLEKLGALVVDADKVGHEAYMPNTRCFHLLVDRFGTKIVSADGNIDRRALGSIVFQNRNAKEELESIVWPEIERMVVKRFESLAEEKCAPGKPCIGVLEAAVLVEAGWTAMVDQVWITSVPEAIAVERIVERNRVTPQEAIDRIRAQLSRSEREQYADVVFDTTGTKQHTRKLLKHAWADLNTKLKRQHHYEQG